MALKIEQGRLDVNNGASIPCLMASMAIRGSSVCR